MDDEKDKLIGDEGFDTGEKDPSDDVISDEAFTEEDDLYSDTNEY